jgi:type IV pilus assembly protein PilA
MLARIRKAQEENEGGFTLIELLVVMIIIGILAAIAIPVFLSQREKARDTATKADISTVGKELATYYVDGADGVPSLAQGADALHVDLIVTVGAVATTVADEIKISSGTVIPAANSSAGTTSQDWCVALTNPDGDTDTFKYTAAGGLATGVCP